MKQNVSANFKAILLYQRGRINAPNVTLSYDWISLLETELSDEVYVDSLLHPLNLVAEITTLLTFDKFVSTLQDNLSTVGFSENLKESTIVYDHENKELIVTNNEHCYSSMYSIEIQAFLSFQNRINRW